MIEKNTLSDMIKEAVARSSKQKVTGKNALARDLFVFLCDRESIDCPLLFCTEKGLLLFYHCDNQQNDVLPQENGIFSGGSGYQITPEMLHRLRTQMTVCDDLSGFLIIFPCQTANAVINQLLCGMERLLRIFDDGERDLQYLLHCLDAVQNSISIYDRDANLLYANKDFCVNMRISDRNAVIGMNVETFLERSGIRFHSMASGSHLKMLDVLKDGEEALDWEVRLEDRFDSSKSLVLSNDMYPVRDADGKISGMIELMRSRQQMLKRMKKIVGLKAEYTFDNIIGTSSIMREKIQTAKEFANNSFNFLITGESGVGKELFAQSIHNYSNRRKGPFIALNCANFSEGLIESELFGYVGGAFTGASKNGQAGKFELADGGTLFLDEIGELPYHFQSKLLRVLETWTVMRIGDSREIPVDVRLIAATNRDLEQMVSEGLFRQDLLYRLQVLNIEVPPLRERREDIPLLADAFLKLASDPNDHTVKILSHEACQTLMEYDWPGNVRELRNVINRVTVLSKTNIISKAVLDASLSVKNGVRKFDLTAAPEDRMKLRWKELDFAYEHLLTEALQITGGNKKEAAQLLGVSRNTLYRMLQKFHSSDD